MILPRLGFWAGYFYCTFMAHLRRPNLLQYNQGGHPGPGNPGNASRTWVAFTFLEVNPVNYIYRLVAAGLSPASAIEAVAWYRSQGDDIGLEKYAQEVEGGCKECSVR